MTLVVVLVVGLLFSGRPAEAADFDIKEATDLQKIFQVIAEIGRFNVLVSPTVKHARTYMVSNIDPMDALSGLAAEQGLVAFRFEAEGRLPDTFLVGMKGWILEPKIPKVPSDSPFKDFEFKSDTSFSTIVQVIAKIGGFEVKIAADVFNKMSFCLRKVHPLQALYLVAAVNGLKVEAVSSSGGVAKYRLVPGR